MPLSIVALHVAAVLLAAAAAPVALHAAVPGVAPRARHRLAGRVYVLAWTGVVATGVLLGVRRPGVSVFEVLNLLGGATVAAGVLVAAVPAARRRVGPGWARWHIRLMLSSTAFLVVATLNQGLSRLPGGVPMWAFYLLVAAPSLVLPRVGRRLARRAGLRTA